MYRKISRRSSPVFDTTYSIANFTREFNGVKRGKATKTEWCLLGLTAVFWCLLLVLSHTEQVPLDPGVVVETETEVPQEEVAPPFEPVDLNTADEAELDTLPGIGEALAGRIIAYREANGPFETVEELLEVSGIGEKKLADLDGWITVNGTADAVP